MHVLFRFVMFSIFDLQDLCGEEERLRGFLRGYGVVSDVDSCRCGQPLGSKWYVDRGSSYRRCSSRACHARVYGKAGGILEGSNLSLAQWTYLAHFWAHNCAGVRAQAIPQRGGIL